MCIFGGGGGGIGQLLAPLAKTGLDPVGKATNEALGFKDKKKPEQQAVAAVANQTKGTMLTPNTNQSSTLLGQ